MASLDEVREAVTGLGGMLSDVDDRTRAKIPDGRVSVKIRDLDTAFAGNLRAGELRDVVEIPVAEMPREGLRLTLDSDDLLELVSGRMSFAHGWSRGRIKVDASLRDLLKLRSFL